MKFKCEAGDDEYDWLLAFKLKCHDYSCTRAEITLDDEMLMLSSCARTKHRMCQIDVCHTHSGQCPMGQYICVIVLIGTAVHSFNCITTITSCAQIDDHDFIHTVK